LIQFLYDYIPIPSTRGRCHETSCKRGGMRRLRALGKRTPGRSGGAGAPPAGIMTCREELADGRAFRPASGAKVRLPKRSRANGPKAGRFGRRKRGPDAVTTPLWSAERRPRSSQEGRGKTENWCAARCSIPSACRREKERPRSPGRQRRRTRRRKEYGRRSVGYLRLILRSIAKRCISKDEGGLMVRDAPYGAPHHEEKNDKTWLFENFICECGPRATSPSAPPAPSARCA
jgi:hypothetical protein